MVGKGNTEILEYCWRSEVMWERDGEIWEEEEEEEENLNAVDQKTKRSSMFSI